MKTKCKIDADLHHVADMINALLKSHSMTLLASDIVTPIRLEHRQMVCGKTESQSIELEIMPY